MALDFEYAATVYSMPQRCPECGSIRTMPNGVFNIFNKGAYEKNLGGNGEIKIYQQKNILHLRLFILNIFIILRFKRNLEILQTKKSTYYHEE